MRALVLLLVLVGCTSSSSDLQPPGSDPTEPPSGEQPEPTGPVPAAGIEITTIAVNQAVGVDVSIDGSEVAEADRLVPLIGGRDAAVRVMWALDADFERRDIEAVLTLEGPKPVALRQVLRVRRDADRNQLDGTFLFDVAGAAIDGSTGLAVELLEVLPEPVRVASVPNRVPAQGTVPLHAWDDPMSLKVRLFACSMDCAEPALPITDSQKTITENILMNLYPVQEVVLTWEDEPWALNACGDGSGLDAMQARRATEGAPPDEYWHCIFPQVYDSWLAGGFAWILTDEPAEPRVSFSVNWWGPVEEMVTNVAHELGHNHGRFHPWEDGGWVPIEAGETGCRASWGLGIRPGPHPTAYWNPTVAEPDTVIMPPAPDVADCPYDEKSLAPVTGDVVSYTHPYWVGAYTFRAFAERIRTVTGHAMRRSEEGRRTLFASPEGEGWRWTWGRGALRDGQQAADAATLHRPDGRQVVVPLHPRVDGNGAVRGFSLALPAGAAAGWVEGRFQGRDLRLDLADLDLG